MKYVDGFRDPVLCRDLVRRIRERATRPWTIMEVCGGQTHGLLRFGIDAELAETVELIHGPGCPVCVTPIEDIDSAIGLATRGGVVLASFGDMLRVPGSRESLLEARARGGDVRIVYSPIDALTIARAAPNREVVLFAVGFETTAAATALAAQQAQSLKQTNFSMLVAHVRVLPAMELLASSRDCRVQAFLAAGHVCTVDGYAQYGPFVRRYRLPVVVAGFEPVDLLVAIDRCVDQLESGRAELENCYGRSAHLEGNRAARSRIASVFEAVDANWRGIGSVPRGGMSLRPEYADWDARRRFQIGERLPSTTDRDCRAGEVLTGRLRPTSCPHFAGACTPETPLGAPMVSAEGACAAYYRYARVR